MTVDNYGRATIAYRLFYRGIMIHTMATKNTPPDNNGKKYNKSKVDARIVSFREYYTTVNSSTFQNVLQSALRAGYSQQYSENLSYLNPVWFSEMQQDRTLMRARMLADSEKHFSDMLNVDSKTNDETRLKLKQATAVHVSETLGKDLYSRRNELTGADGRRLFTNEKRVDATIPLTNLFKGIASSK